MRFFIYTIYISALLNSKQALLISEPWRCELELAMLLPFMVITFLNAY